MFSGGFNAGCLSLRCVWGEIVVCNTFVYHILFWFWALLWVSLHEADVKDAINALQTKVVEQSFPDLVVITVCGHGTAKM